ncbi:MAG: hypothetical protein Q8M96_20750, partial [Rubrivivax sp.]|nr:hypothetical protein [Rubrivivax sp.]
MRKSLERQAALGPVFDVTLDGKDGAPVGGERDHAALMAELVSGCGSAGGAPRRRGRRQSGGGPRGHASGPPFSVHEIADLDFNKRGSPNQDRW